jgi:hypothetical protein
MNAVTFRTLENTDISAFSGADLGVLVFEEGRDPVPAYEEMAADPQYCDLYQAMKISVASVVSRVARYRFHSFAPTEDMTAVVACNVTIAMLLSGYVPSLGETSLASRRLKKYSDSAYSKWSIDNLFSLVGICMGDREVRIRFAALMLVVRKYFPL